MKTPLLIAALLLSAATSALAHSKAETTEPADAATVTAVDTIAIRFETPMRVTALTLTGPDGAIDVERETGLDPVTEFRASPAGKVPAGMYRVEWRGLSMDGHPMQGTFGFTVAD